MEPVIYGGTESIIKSDFSETQDPGEFMLPTFRGVFENALTEYLRGSFGLSTKTVRSLSLSDLYPYSGEDGRTRAIAILEAVKHLKGVAEDSDFYVLALEMGSKGAHTKNCIVKHIVLSGIWYTEIHNKTTPRQFNFEELKSVVWNLLIDKKLKAVALAIERKRQIDEQVRQAYDVVKPYVTHEWTSPDLTGLGGRCPYGGPVSSTAATYQNAASAGRDGSPPPRTDSIHIEPMSTMDRNG